MAYNFLPCDRNQAYLLPHRWLTGCRKTTSRGSFWTSSITSTFSRFTRNTVLTALATQRSTRR